MFGSIKARVIYSFFVVTLAFSIFASPAKAQGADFNQAQISVTFDDSVASTYTKALPILSQRGIKATVFAITGTVETAGHVTWPQLLELQNQYGWEVGSHTVTHPSLAKLTLSKIKTEVNSSYATLISKGFVVSSFATPYGEYNNAALIEILKTYNLHRSFADLGGANVFPYNRAFLSVRSVDAGYTASDVKSWIDQAKAEKKWLILVLHEVADNPDPNYAYTTTVADLTQIADYIKSSGIKVVLPNETLVKPGANLFTNSTFTNGIADGWTTDRSTYVKVDTGSNGSYPSAKESVMFTGSNTASHLFSNPVMAGTDSIYSLSAFVNTDRLSSGSINFYLDEYDSNGNWVSGRSLGSLGTKKVTYYTTQFKLTSSNVKSFKIETYISKGAKGTVFVDNYEMYQQSVVSPVANLVTNPGFESLTDGWAADWKTDSSSFSIDTGSNGDSGTNSLHLSPNGAEAHVFSSHINVTYGNTYVWDQYVKVISGKGEFGFYIDEYDSNGNWISGQWKDAVYSTFVGTKTISYSPSSAAVASVDLQYYANANSNFELYLDSVRFFH